jgi:hypothetical protein
VGVVFNGKVQHAGQAVTSGVRHVLVFSLSITNTCYVSNSAAKQQEQQEQQEQQSQLSGTCEHCEEDCDYNVEYI